MRYVFCVMLWAWPILALAQEWEDERLFEGVHAARTLRVLSSTDTSFFEPVIDAFVRQNPDVSVAYYVNGTARINEIFREAPEAFDVVISSAMDLQLKLVNDGMAQRVSNMSQPDWAQWRESLFAFTTEPATIVMNRTAFPDGDMPGTRQELIQALRARPDVFRGRVGTYDVRQSGLGYLFATQDARASETYWRLMEIMGGLDAQLYCCSGDMIDDLVTGDLLVAYNVLGSYAAARVDVAQVLEIVSPSDFPTTMMRTAFVSADTNVQKDAEAFVRHLLAVQTGPGDPDVFPLPSLQGSADAAGQPVISLEPALMTYLDPLKRRTFIKEWSSAVIQ
ncbi:ABC transporter substrate-binding protein [Shimia sp. NS0008-38b]|uniref:ABC transporter substrate-binding protein n=1 Tax=Shimia sp. NS0008-38b TaxID=3127653 RepID=UPI00310B372E